MKNNRNLQCFAFPADKTLWPLVVIIQAVHTGRETRPIIKLYLAHEPVPPPPFSKSNILGTFTVDQIATI
jgi:hypothetical protein